MAMPNVNYWFRPGRSDRKGRKNPGILAVDDSYELTAMKCNKEETMWYYKCKYNQTPKIKCSAKAKVIIWEDKWIVESFEGGHCCGANKPRVISELLRHEMKCIVRSDPVQPVGKAIIKIREDAAKNWSTLF